MRYLQLILPLVCVLSVQSETVCHPPCGCFSDDEPWDDRPLPESPEEQEIEWLLYTQANPSIGRDVSWDGDGNVEAPPQYDPAKNTIFLIHGWVSSPDLKVSMNELKDTFLNKYDFNVITVDWSTGANKPTYLPAASNTRVVGACTAHIARELTTVDNVHCIGHSLGAHTCGYMGDDTNGQLAHATGLDPAGPGFYEDDPRLRLDVNDAVFVDTLNTNAEELGLGFAIGHVDFYPNKGINQPPCSPGGSVCDHSICKDYYQASIEEEGDGECDFWAYPCDSEADADAGNCNSCIEAVNCQKMGYYANTQPGRGTFYLETLRNYPYCEN